MVIISPYDRNLIQLGSDVRRKFIDGVIAQYDKIYLADLIKSLNIFFSLKFAE